MNEPPNPATSHKQIPTCLGDQSIRKRKIISLCRHLCVLLTISGMQQNWRYWYTRAVITLLGLTTHRVGWSKFYRFIKCPSHLRSISFPYWAISEGLQIVELQAIAPCHPRFANISMLQRRCSTFAFTRYGWLHLDYETGKNNNVITVLCWAYKIWWKRIFKQGWKSDGYVSVR